GERLRGAGGRGRGGVAAGRGGGGGGCGGGQGQRGFRRGARGGGGGGRAPAGTGGHAADHLRAAGVLAPRHVERAARQADVAGRRLAQRGRDERRRRHRGLRQHGAVGEERADALAQAGV